MQNNQLAYLYLLSPLHTGGASQEGNLVGIAKESHTELPYLPSSTVRGRLRAETSSHQVFINKTSGQISESEPDFASSDSQSKDWTFMTLQAMLWGNTIADVTQGDSDNLTQGSLWLGDAAILWFPIPSLSHGVVWISSPLLLKRWLRLTKQTSLTVPQVGRFSGGKSRNLYLKDAVFKKNSDTLKDWHKTDWAKFLPIPDKSQNISTISELLVLSDQDCKILIESSLWRQVRVNLDDKKTVVGGFRYEEAIPPETLMYFSWGTTNSVKAPTADFSARHLSSQLEFQIKQFGGQESLGRGFVETWTDLATSPVQSNTIATAT